MGSYLTRKGTRRITVEVDIDTTAEASVDVDFSLIGEFIDQCSQEDLATIIKNATSNLSGDRTAPGSLIYNSATIMEEFAMNDLQEVLRFKGPEYIMPILKTA